MGPPMQDRLRQVSRAATRQRCHRWGAAGRVFPASAQEAGAHQREEMVAAEPLEESELHAPRRIEPTVRIEPAGFQSLPAERKPGEAVGLALRRGHGQLPAEVDGSTEVAAAEAVRGTRRT